ncbi:VanZ family protein [Alienimonas californiensis]|uniref:VanZ like family protein n=1 Tax=Alienimonas californiensis TaxID=2527989 RepID=A0A517P465_9PLAN|nr:VanZ family protein [Alienimonas californiensis]QDT14159.1 VanZ like family protein [Alienimonas californiensis]
MAASQVPQILLTSSLLAEERRGNGFADRPKLLPRLVAVAALILWATGTADADVMTVGSDAELRRALSDAGPGDTVLILPGEYRGGIRWSPRGEPGRPITLAGTNRDDPPVFRGGFEVFRLHRPTHTVLRDLIIEGSGDNGLNADDSGRRDQPAGPLTLQRITSRDSGGRGNHDGFKLTGIDDLKIVDCTVSGWGRGGQGIDLVGCHNVIVRGCRIDGGGKSAVGLQAKGGSRDVLFADCRVEGVTERCVNVGGLTGDQFFRPPGATAEATEVRVLGCELVGASAAVAFIGSDSTRVENCVLYRQTRYPIRILRENNGERMVPTRGGEFVGNTVVWHDGDLLTFVNVGANSRPETFTFAGNIWYCVTHPARSTPSGLPVEEVSGVYGVDPKLKDPPQNLTPTRPAADLHKEASVRAERHRLRLTVAAVLTPLALGILWWLHRTAARAIRPRPVTTDARFAAPPPRRSHAVFALAGWISLMAAASLAPFSPADGGSWLSVDWGTTFRRFADLPFDAEAISNVDWTVNTLAGVPLGFFAVAVAMIGRGFGRPGGAFSVERRSLFWSITGVVAAIGGSAALAFILESSQLLLEGRTSTKYDLYAQVCGAVMGVAAWFAVGPSATQWVKKRLSRSRAVRTLQPIDFAAVIAVALVAVWTLRPFDPLVHPVDLYHKLQGGGFRPVPFGPGWTVEDFTWSVLRAVPFGLLAAIFWTPPDRPTRTFRPAWVVGLVAAAALEGGQFFVRGRVCDVTDVLAAAVGAAVGASLASVFARSPFLTPVPMAGRGLNVVRWTVGVGLASVACLIYAGSVDSLG